MLARRTAAQACPDTHYHEDFIMSMSLAVSTYSLIRWRKAEGKTFEDTIAFVAELGVQGIEFSNISDEPVDDPIARAKALRQACDAAGLKAPSHCVGAELYGDPARLRAEIDRLKVSIDVAAILGATSFRHDVLGKPPAVPFDDFLASVVPACREVTRYAAEKGIKTSLENHGFFLQTADRVEALVKAVDDPNFGVTLDMGNFLCLNQDPVDAVRRLLPYAVMVHAKDFHIRPKDRMPPSGWFSTPTPIALRGAILGHGQIDVPAQLALLKAANYNGWLSLEFEGMEDPRTAVRLGIEYLKGQLASDG